AARGEEDGVHVVEGDLHEAVGERDGRDVGRADVAGEVRELLHLGRGGVGELRAPVPDVDVPEPREPVDVLVAPDVPDRRPAPADVDHWLRVLRGMVERMDQVILVGLHELGGGQRHCVLPTVTVGSRAAGPGDSRRPGSGRHQSEILDTSTPTPARAGRAPAWRSPGDAPTWT